MTRNAEMETLRTLRCPISFDTMLSPVLTSCGHRFCEGCLRVAIGIKKECPTCRERVSSHRSFRADADFAALTSSTQARGLQAAESELCNTNDDMWSCTVCTLRNLMACSRCEACGSCRWAPRRPHISEDGPGLEAVECLMMGAEAFMDDGLCEEEAVDMLTEPSAWAKSFTPQQ